MAGPAPIWPLYASRMSRVSHDRTPARQRSLAPLIWASFLVFVFVAGIGSRIWLR